MASCVMTIGRFYSRVEGVPERSTESENTQESSLEIKRTTGRSLELGEPVGDRARLFEIVRVLMRGESTSTSIGFRSRHESKSEKKNKREKGGR